MASRFNVKAFRGTHGLSAQHVADALGVHIRTVRRWDSGDADPSPMALKALQDLKSKHDVPMMRDAETPAPASSSDKPRRPALLPSID